MKRYSQRLTQLWVLLLSSAMVGAQTTVPPANGPLTISYQNVDIGVIAEAVGEATGVTFILDQRVRANLSFDSKRSLNRQQVYDQFVSLLQVNGYAALRSGNVVKIVPEGNARTMPGNDLPTNLNMGADEMVTDVLEVKNINATQIAQVLRQMLSPAGNVAPVPGTSFMYIIDRASNVARIKRLLARVDQSSNASVDVVKLENAVAEEVARFLNSLVTGTPAEAAAGGAAAPKVVADPRTNSVYISGDPGQRLRIADLLDTLDAPVADGGGARVIALKYAKAEELATTLNAQIKGVTAAAGAAGGAGAAATSVAAIADRSVTIQPDKVTNKLIITAPPRTLLSLMAIINELDIPLPQVHIEAYIVDVSEGSAADLGVNWAVFSTEDGTRTPAAAFIAPVGSGNNNPVSIVDLAAAVANPATAATIPLGATFGIGKLRDNGTSLAAMIRALRSDGNTNVVSWPNVIARNNEEAAINSVQEVPVITGQYVNTGGGGVGAPNAFTPIQRLEVGTKLKVTPQIIPASGELVLDIDLESSELSGDTGDAGSLITNKRSVKTSVQVQSGSTIVIGGMMRDSKVTGETRVPFLGRIPVIGEAFKVRSGKRGKATLMIFIQPRILVDALQAHTETTDKYNRIRELQLQQNQHRDLIPLLPGDKPPELPVMPGYEPPVIPVPPPVAPANP